MDPSNVSAAPGVADYRRALKQYVTAEELRSLAEPSLAASARFVALQWLAIALLFAAAHVSLGLAAPWNGLAAVPLVFLLGTRVTALNSVTHEASHGLLAKSPATNRWLCNLGAAHWIGHSLEEFRPTHNLHHSNLHTEVDPDRAFYEIPESRFGWLALVAQDLLGITSARRVAGFSRQRSGEPAPPRRFQATVLKAACQGVILLQFVAFQGLAVGVVAYVVFWLVPILSVFPLMIRLKTVVEHYDPLLQRIGPAFFVSRTSRAGAFEDALFGVHMEYHFEHHLLSHIPYHGLERLHAMLIERGYFEAVLGGARETAVSDGYTRFWANLGRLRARSGPPEFATSSAPR